MCNKTKNREGFFYLFSKKNLTILKAILVSHVSNRLDSLISCENGQFLMIEFRVSKKSLCSSKFVQAANVIITISHFALR